MSNLQKKEKMTNYRWTILVMLFMATTINYLDRQVLSLTWADFIAPEFHWTNSDYGTISGILTAGITAGEWTMSFAGAREAIGTVGDVLLVVSVSVTLFVFARLVLAIGSLGFIWMGFWVFIYHKPEKNKRVNALELAYINQDDATDAAEGRIKADENAGKKVSFKKAFKYKQTWSFAVGKFLTDGVWWFLLFLVPAYLKSVYGLNSTQSAPHVFVVYAISMISVFAAGFFPAWFMTKKKLNPYEGRMRAMLLFAFVPLLVLLAQPLGTISAWLPIIMKALVPKYQLITDM